MIGFFNGQTEYNYLENAISLENYVLRCKEFNFQFVTITDKNMHAYYKFYNLCIKHNLKPIIGLKLSVENDVLLAYAKNDEGLSKLFYLSKQQEDNKLSYDMLIDSNLFFVTNNDSKFNKLIESKEYEEAVKFFNEYKGIELYIGLDKVDDVELYKNNNIKILPIQNALYLDKEDLNIYQTIVKIGNKEVKSCTHILNKEEFKSRFNYEFDLTFINNIVYIDLLNEISLPIFDKKINSQKYIKELTDKGLIRRLELNNKQNQYSEYKKRLDYELDIINSMGFNDYFLIVWDLIKYAKKNNILVGAGRGSAAGSLVSFCLGITEIDPIEYNLYFERFLNPQRITMPDIDIDFPDNKREEVIQYVKDKYGSNHVCYISAFNTFGIKSSIRDICRVNNVKVDHANLMLKHIDNYGFEDAIEKYKSREDLIEVLTIASKINGLIRHISTHAAGIIISSTPLDKFTPLRVGINNVYQSQLEGCDLENKGFLKIDFLGIRNLSLVHNMIEKLDIKLNNINLNDKKTYDLLSSADTDGIFQLESSGIKNVLRKLKPNTFEDIVSVLALYRPGPMENIDEFIERKKDKKITYLTSKLEKILQSTNGIIVYQEQIMEIANEIAGYSYAEADLLRRAISKKDKKILDDNRILFVSKSKENNFDENISNEIYDLIVKFADYGFNKSHSVAYSMLSYQMAFLKANHPTIFIAEMINNSISDKVELKKYIEYAKSKAISVISPKINHSLDEVIVLNNKILLPFNTIQKLGISTAKLIVEERKKSKFNSFEDFKNRCSFLNENNFENLIFSCALDEFNLTKKNMNNTTDDLFSKYLTDKLNIEEEYEFDVLKEKELESLGININYDIFKNNTKILEKYKYSKEIKDIKENANIRVVALIESIKEIDTKNNDKMAFVSLDLNFIKISGVVFPSQYEKFKDIDTKKLVYLDASVQKRNDELQLVLNNFKNI